MHKRARDWFFLGVMYVLTFTTPACAERTALIRTDIAEGYRFLRFVDTDRNKRYDIVYIADSQEELNKGAFREVLEGEAVVNSMYLNLLHTRFQKITGQTFVEEGEESNSDAAGKKNLEGTVNEERRNEESSRNLEDSLQ